MLPCPDFDYIREEISIVALARELGLTVSGYSIIDCPSISVSGDLLSIARYVDGVLLVVEANCTRREEPALAEQRIAAAGGVLVGIILNKHKPEVPAWIDSLL